MHFSRSKLHFLNNCVLESMGGNVLSKLGPEILPLQAKLNLSSGGCSSADLELSVVDLTSSVEGTEVTVLKTFSVTVW